MSAADEDELVLEAGGARAVIVPAEGGRLGSVAVDGLELLITDRTLGPMQWGAYPMAPWTGRIRDGHFAFGGREHRLPLGLPPHAIHGVVFDRPWRTTGPGEITIQMDSRWPFRGRVTQRFALAEDGLDVTMTLEADEPMPVAIGWHPWFRRVLEPGGATVELRFAADEMLVQDETGIPTGERVAPSPGPWDDAFTGVRVGPELEWPGRLRLALSSSCAWWVVYTKPEDAICVEPESGPPDAANREPEVVTRGAPMTHTMRWRWTRLQPGADR